MSEAPAQAGGGGGGWSAARSAAGGGNPWIIATVVSISTFMEVLDTSIANVALRHIAGGLSASYDEATWVLTSYLIANAITVPISSWLSSVVGRKRYYMICVAGFGVASAMCGLAPNLTVLILARVLQGLAGGGLQPTTQAILVDTFPPQRRGLALALFGLTVILAPTIGPTLGGVITDDLSWRWIFFINLPVAALSLFLVQTVLVEPKTLEKERQARIDRGLRLDVIGFAFIAIGLGCLEYTMDRGQRLDWFSDASICMTAVLAVVGIGAFVVREFTTEEPLLNLRLFASRNYSLANVLILVVGVILFGTTQFLPQLLQEVLGYTATNTGYAMTAGGAVTLLIMPLVGVLTGKVQPRWLLAFGMAIETFAMWRLTDINGDISFAYAAQMRVWIAAGIPFLFVPLSNAAYVGLPANQSSQASSMLSISRNLGGTLGISLVQTFLAQREQFHQSRLVEGLNPLNPNYQAQTAEIASRLRGIGIGSGQLDGVQMGNLYQTVLRQAELLSYMDVFWVLTLFVGCMAPLVLFLRTQPPARGAAP
ncbi:DHA2 family efflux MFS transporter permease subunit [Phenylobacterium sp.]|uniref:DHA2 family efflux MFS transporter permease subunit n=1 Tax=Phenylobacterium sp. TaxID=1871053 RepID=UPI0025F906B1|nr:DHA2 family efflux MFS transporter permease subunit [Phenylobacterium sp.]